MNFLTKVYITSIFVYVVKGLGFFVLNALCFVHCLFHKRFLFRVTDMSIEDDTRV